MKKRKHRLVVEFTTSKAVTEKRSAQLFQMLIDGLDIQAHPIDALGVYPDKIQAKQFSRVVAANLGGVPLNTEESGWLCHALLQANDMALNKAILSGKPQPPVVQRQYALYKKLAAANDKLMGKK